MTRLEFLERARNTHGYKYKYPNLSDKVLSSDDIDILYKEINYKQKVVKHLLGRCPEKATLIKTNSDYIKEAKDIWGDKYDYSLTEYKGALNKIKIIYEGTIYEQIATSHLKYAPEKVLLKITDVKFINESNYIHNNKYSYDKVKYESNNKSVIINCPIHGDFLQKPIIHLQGDGCSDCIESKVIKSITKYLNKNKISYYRQHKFKDCSRSFDFYIASMRTVIIFTEDSIKDDYCEDNFIELIHIKYDQLDKIESYLNEVFKYKK